MGTMPLPERLRRTLVPLAVAVVLILAALPAPPADAVEIREVVRYDLFSRHALATNEDQVWAVAGPDGHVLVVWAAWQPGTYLQTVWARWLGPDGTPDGRTVEISRRDGVEGVAVRAGRRALVVTQSWEPDAVARVVALEGDRVVRSGRFPDPACDDTQAVTATELGYFVVCDRWQALEVRRFGWWLGPTGRGRHTIELEPGYEVAAAGGVRNGVAIASVDEPEGPLYARWLTPSKVGAPTVVDPMPSPYGWSVHPSVTHLRDRVFALAWVREHDRGTDISGDLEWRQTAVHAATFHAPGAVRGARRLSPLSTGAFGGNLAEHRQPFVLTTGDRAQLVGWFGCGYISSPGGVLCSVRDGLYLRERWGGGLAGPVVSLPGVAAHARIVHTGELLLAVRLRRAALNLDRWSLEVRGWTVD